MSLVCSVCAEVARTFDNIGCVVVYLLTYSLLTGIASYNLSGDLCCLECSFYEPLKLYAKWPTHPVS